MRHAANIVCFAVFGGMVAGLGPTEGGPGGEEGEEVWRKFVGHVRG